MIRIVDNLSVPSHRAVTGYLAVQEKNSYYGTLIFIKLSLIAILILLFHLLSGLPSPLTSSLLGHNF
jgi:hypothetical protein